MGFNVPLINRDSAQIVAAGKQWSTVPENQKKMVLVIVSIALLLDNMLYMVIVPIIPKYLRDIHAYTSHLEGYTNNSVRLDNGSILVKKEGGHFVFDDEETQLGWLFASKALLQIFINPFSGYIIDRIGYEIPMIIGLTTMFSSTALFALGRSYNVLFFARSLQGFGSAFADTSGLAMIADRFCEEHERSAALGIALAFISFGCLVAPPFGSVLYNLAGKPVPFLVLACICLADAFAVFFVIQPRPPKAVDKTTGEKVQGTPMWRLFMDPMIAVCSGALIMANVSLAFLEPTISNFITETMRGTPAWQIGMVWLPPFFPHVLGVYVTVKLLARFPEAPWAIAAVGLAMEGVACIFVPFTTSIAQLVVPLSFVCFGIALIDTSILPLLGFLVDTRHVSVYGSVYAIADISYSLAYAFGPIIAGAIMSTFGFLALNIIIAVTNVGYAPALAILRNVHGYKEMAERAEMMETKKAEEYGEIEGADRPQPTTTAINTNYQAEYGTQNGLGYDPLNPQW